MKKIRLLFWGLLIVSVSCAHPPKRELRGMWIATVANIDWPRSQTTDPAALQHEMNGLLDAASDANLNCVVFQIRPTADAFYQSAHEPWSHWLTGEQGRAPSFDPLQYVIDECDRRGMLVHVWINPYRVWLDSADRFLAGRDHLLQRHPERIVQYGKTAYLHPALRENRDYICRVVADIVRHYDIDAVHMDDYFYPYRVAGEEFPDEREFRRDPRGFKSKDDWRRDNVDRIIRQIRDTIKAVKPWVEFGISPFGVWRNKDRDPKGSATRAGQTNYDDLYADILKWEREGWIDYAAPQLYWHIGFPAADYRVLAEWWNRNAYKTPLYIGHASYRITPSSGTKAWKTPEEIIRQIRLNRTLAGIGGSIMYSAKSLLNPELRKALKESVYRSKSLPPENPRIRPVPAEAPGSPVVWVEEGFVRMNWQPEEGSRRYAVYRFRKGEKADFSDPEHLVAVTGSHDIRLPMPEDGKNGIGYRYAVTALSATHLESEPVWAVAAED